MFDLDKWQEIFATILKNKLRTTLTALSVIWGIFMLVFMLGMGNGFENGVRSQFGKTATNSCFVWCWKTSKPYMGLKPGRFVQFNLSDIAAVKSQIKDIEYISPEIERNFLVKRGNENSTFEIKGQFPDKMYIQPMEVTSGRFINTLDIEHKRKVTVLGTEVIRQLFKDEDPIGQYVNIKGVFFRVIGIFKSYEKGERGQNEEKKVIIPFTTMQQAFNTGVNFGFFALTAKPGKDVSIVEDQVVKLIRKRKKADPEDRMAVGSWNMQKEFGKIQGLFSGINGLIWIVGVCTVIAGIIGVSNIMLIVVKERTKEIGLRKALGATPWSIISLVLQESIFITTISGYIGLIAGIGVVEGVRQLLIAFDANGEFFANPQVNLTAAVAATLFLIIGGAFAGLMPASKAANISPIEALRDE